MNMKKIRDIAVSNGTSVQLFFRALIIIFGPLYNLKMIFLPPTNEVWESYVFTGVCLSTGGPAVPCHICPSHACRPATHAPCHACPPAMHTPRHACPLPCRPTTMHALPAMHAPLLRPPCHACPHHAGCAWQGRGACMVGGRVCQERWPLQQAVRILLECILVQTVKTLRKKTCNF